ncbi:hypothetical protein EDB19DRAFT_1800235 [Suillus lakei]|nr:hypothetical protein EDB19DRAFT_1800235 [Suillus lakei]
MMTLSASLDVIPRSRTALEIEQCHAHIDQELAALAESMRVLRSRKNALAYTSLLPPEILATIFIYTVEEDNYTGTPRCCGAPLCLAVTHVCRHWRLVALECPTLWTSINCASPHWVSTMLERSRKAALVITYSAPASLRPCFKQILSQLPRIKILQLCSFSSDVNRIIDCLSSQPAPLLQMFKLSVQGVIHPKIDAIFQGCAPQLRSVELVQCNFSWTLGILSGLRTLEVRQTVSSSPTLSQLLLRLGLLPTSSEDNELFDKVSLARLKSMALAGFTIRTAISLFSHLLLPVDVKIALNIARTVGSEGLFGLCSAIHKDVNESFPVIRSMRARRSSNVFGVQFSTSTAFTSEYIWNPPDETLPSYLTCVAWSRITKFEAYLRHSPLILKKAFGVQGP